ncbi:MULTISPECIES: GspH/FimT family pseudopilin [unclassified Pseudomonas]|uniref:GspH/FimT family pseudopilin n=1 Tax=unclassified Pseudomonas TaxID=196821 RepID=UPI00129DFFB1|nr:MULTISPECIES: GspH/FimT family pseudopilin [unclassified Pseudomonas]MDH4654327.1 prepilin-type N-terminal cleavage/methylation domain-containing protein [Pseudomonas sp. BN606]MRK23636.1 prepilin-type N-terminal cleavage/methylation domain-containing protein [Pseudomonas sp. JG-B]
MTSTSRAFTLIETLFTLAIIGICFSFGLPAFSELVRSQQLHSASQELTMSLVLARHESVMRGIAVLVDNQDGDWSTGWWVYADQNGNGRWDKSDPLIRQIGPQPAGVIIKGNSPVRRYIRYTPTGRATMLGGAFQAGTLTLCHSEGKSHVRKLVINAAGRVRRAKQPPGPC